MQEIGLYYLQSRYYDPATGRFLNADGQFNDGLLGFNLFAYCGNNSVNKIDPSGFAAVTDLDSDPTDDVSIPGTKEPFGGTGNSSPTVYRGGSYTARSIDVTFYRNSQLIKPTRGISVNVDPTSVAKFGRVSVINALPSDLSLRQVGRIGHYEIVPNYPMSFSNYQNLLNLIQYTLLGG